MSLLRQAPGAKSVKILTPLVVSSFCGRLIRQNMSKLVKICQFSFFRGADKTTDLSYDTFRLLRCLFGSGMYFRVVLDLRKKLPGPGCRFSARTVAIKSSSLPFRHCQYQLPLKACAREQMWIVFRSNFPCMIDSDVIVFGIIQKTKDPWCYVPLNLSPRIGAFAMFR